MQEIPRLRIVTGCVKIRENYRLKGALQWISFDPRKGDGHVSFARERIHVGSRIVSRLYYDINDKVILTEIF